MCSAPQQRGAARGSSPPLLSACRLFAARPRQPGVAFPPPMAPIARPVSTLTPRLSLTLVSGASPSSWQLPHRRGPCGPPAPSAAGLGYCL